jgi:SRSO17 transposase
MRVVAIRSNHAAWLPQGQRVRQNQWRKFDRVFSDGSSQQRYIRAKPFKWTYKGKVLAV